MRHPRPRVPASPSGPSKIRARLASAVAAVALVALAACGGGGGTEPTNQPPVASFTASPTSGVAPLQVAFDATASTDPDGSIATYLWDFGDGASGSGPTVEHAYGPGTFTARLTVTDDRGAAAQASVTIDVEAVTTGFLSGTVSVGLTGPGAFSPLAERAGSPHAGPSWSLNAAGEAPFVPGELIVAFRDGVRPLSVDTLEALGVTLVRNQALGPTRAALYRWSTTSAEATLEAARALMERSDVAYAHPNYLMQAQRVPNDALYEFQWHYPAISLPDAWDITTGDPDTVIAVLDSGILHSFDVPSLTHPDFEGKIVAGYDFISDPSMSGDGSGRDPDPYDVGDVPGGQSTYHGSHVAGTVAARTDDAFGVAGVDWHAKIQPIRVLGIGGGTTVDIYQGALWAAGFAIDGVPPNPTPAHVLNMSLGGAISCPPAVQDVLNAIAEVAIVVVAAGNENQNASGFAPASCANVITVGATDFAGARAPYSNFGTRIDVMAPGGDVTADLNGDGFPDGVLSPWRNDATGDLEWFFQNGTSMAAPHVAGVIGLMRAVDPTIDGPRALEILRATARPLSTAECARPTAAECGAGLIDAHAALTAVQDGTIGAPPTGEPIVFDPASLEFGSDVSERTVTLTNTTDATLSWSLTGYLIAGDAPGTLSDGAITADVVAGTIGPGGSASVTVGIDRSQVSADGFYQLVLTFDAGSAEDLELPLRFTKSGDATAPELSGPMIAASFVEDATTGEWVLAGALVESATFDTFRFETLTGDNLVIVWSDENDNEEIDAGDYLGVADEPVSVGPGEEVVGVDVTIERVLESGDVDLADGVLDRLRHGVRDPAGGPSEP